MSKLFLIFALLSTLTLDNQASAQTPAHSGKPSPSGDEKIMRESLTGTYKDKENELKVLELPNGKLRIQLQAYYFGANAKKYGPNLGDYTGEAALQGDTAVVKPTGDDQPCEITLKFSKNKVVVSQKGDSADCGFGMNVTADGTYLRRSTRAPKFDEQQ